VKVGSNKVAGRMAGTLVGQEGLEGGTLVGQGKLAVMDRQRSLEGHKCRAGADMRIRAEWGTVQSLEVVGHHSLGMLDNLGPWLVGI